MSDFIDLLQDVDQDTWLVGLGLLAIVLLVVMIGGNR